MYKHFLKRVIDFLISFIALIVLFPLLLIFAILVKVTSKGPAIFKQERVGKNGKVYKMWKFRSMCQGAEQMEGGVYCKKGDARVTKIGKFMRATSIDELPQLINILRGDMAIIGPRPVLTYYPKKWEEYTEEEKIRFKALPGITGWAAVHGRKTNTIEKRFEYDNYYVEHLSFWLDVKIFFKTIKAVFTNEGNEDDGSSEVKQEVKEEVQEELSGEVKEELKQEETKEKEETADADREEVVDGKEVL